MNIEKLNRLCEMYRLLNEENNISREQKIVYNIEKFMIDLDSVIQNYNLGSILNNNIIGCFQAIGATQYVNLLNKTLNDLLSNKPKDVTINFLTEINQLLESDKLEEYLFSFIQENDLEKDLQYYDTFLSHSEKKETNKKRLKRRKNNWLILTICLTAMYILPLMVAMIDLGEDGNTFNLLNTIINFVTVTVALTIFVPCHNLLIAKKVSKTIWKVLLDILVLFIIFFVMIFISITGATGFLMLSPTFVILINMKDSCNTIKNEIKEDCSFSNFYNSKSISTKDHIEEKPESTANIQYFARTKKASLAPSIISIILSIILLCGSVISIILDPESIGLMIAEIIFIVFILYCIVINYQILRARIKINKIDRPEYLIQYNSQNESLCIDLTDSKKVISLKDINYVENTRLNNHSYSINGIKVYQDIVNVLLILLKNGEVISLYFIDNPFEVANKLSNLISNN